MNKRFRGTLSAVVVASIVMGGVGLSPLIADAKTSVVKPSNVKVAADKKIVTDYVKKTKNELDKYKESIEELDFYTVESYSDLIKYDDYGISSVELMKNSYLKSGILKVISADTKNLSSLKEDKKVRAELADSLKNVKNTSDVSKHRKKLTDYSKNHRVLYKSVMKTYDKFSTIEDEFSVFMEKQRTLSDIIYGDDIDVIVDNYKNIKIAYDQQVEYDIFVGKRDSVSYEKFYAMSDSLDRKFDKSYLKGVESFYGLYLKKLANGNVLGAHNNYVTYTQDAYKKSLDKWKLEVTTAYDHLYKLK